MFSMNEPIDPEWEESCEEPWSCCQCGAAVTHLTEVIAHGMSFCSRECAEEYGAAQYQKQQEAELL